MEHGSRGNRIDGSVHGPVVQANVIHGGVHFLPGAMSWGSVEAWMAPRDG